MSKQIHLMISGRVQGVFFRASAVHIARGFKVTGFVRNLANGNVELLGEGDEEALKRLLDWCKKGPPGARVENVDIKWGESTHQYTGFDTR